MPTIHFGAMKRKEKLPIVVTQGKGLKIYPFEFSTRSLGLPISNPEGSFFSSLSCIFGFCSFVFGPPLLYMFHDIHRFQAFFCVRLFSTCSINAIIKTKKSMVPMPTTSFQHLFEGNQQILAPIRKYVHMSKINEIGSKHIFHLVINIIINNDNFQFILQCVKITMY